MRDAVRSFPPAYFAMVMATGIVSVAAHLLDFARIAQALFALNVVAYVVVTALTLLRAAWHPRALWLDVIDHRHGPTLFASVAATAVLGTQFVLMANDVAIGWLLWALASLLWVVLTYTAFTAFTIRKDKPRLAAAFSGGWLLAVVAMQSVAVLSSYLGAYHGSPYRLELDFLALSMWLAGGMLYVWIASLIFYRCVFVAFEPADFSPQYWINMGAMAISTLAGSLLILDAHDTPFLATLEPFLRGFTVFYWAAGTWWIPLLIVLTVWRHVYARLPLRYEPAYWSAVFPVGMYTACTYEMARALGLDFLYAVPRVLVYVALAVWALAFAGMLRGTFAATRTRLQREAQ
jgi:tellurite resistance protein TehA-like permease